VFVLSGLLQDLERHLREAAGAGPWQVSIGEPALQRTVNVACCPTHPRSQQTAKKTGDALWWRSLRTKCRVRCCLLQVISQVPALGKVTMNSLCSPFGSLQLMLFICCLLFLPAG
jgi:hypothetical protein